MVSAALLPGSTSLTGRRQRRWLPAAARCLYHDDLFDLVCRTAGRSSMILSTKQPGYEIVSSTPKFGRKEELPEVEDMTSTSYETIKDKSRHVAYLL